MSLLSVCQDVIAECGFGLPPSTIIGNTDSLAVQMLAICQDAVSEIADEHAWQAMTLDFTITTVSGDDSYVIAQTGPTGAYYRNFLPDTGWDTTNKLPLIGPLTESEYSTFKNGILTLAARRRYWFMKADTIYIYPTPNVNGDVLVIRMIAEGPVVFVTDGITGHVPRFLNDQDSTLFPEKLLRLALRWKLRKAKGFDYAEDYNAYKAQLEIAKARDSSSRSINFSRAQPFQFYPNLPQTISGV